MPRWLLMGMAFGACQAANPAYHDPTEGPELRLSADAATTEIPDPLLDASIPALDALSTSTDVNPVSLRDAPPARLDIAPVDAQQVMALIETATIDSAAIDSAVIDSAVIDSAPPDGPTTAVDSSRLPTAAASLLVWMTMDEGSGIVAADNILPASNGRLMNGTLWVPGRLPGSNCLQFDGRDDFVELDWKERLILTDSKTVSVWVQPAGPPNNPIQNIFSLTNTRARAGFQIGFIGTTLDMWHWDGNSITSTAAPFVGWHHVAVTQQGALFILYLDGRPADSGSYTFSNDPIVHAVLGAYIAVTGEPAELFRGRLDDFRIYGRALTAAEVAQIATGD